MGIKLKQIEMVKDRTGASYSEAKEALERCNGDVDAAIDMVSELMDHEDCTDKTITDNAFVDKMKEIVEKGNVSRIVIKKGGAVVFSFPVTVGILGAVAVPWAAVIGAIATIGSGCVVEFENENGIIAKQRIDGEKVSEFCGKAVSTGKKVIDKGGKVVKFGIDKAEKLGVKDKLSSLLKDIDKKEE